MLLISGIISAFYYRDYLTEVFLKNTTKYSNKKKYRNDKSDSYYNKKVKEYEELKEFINKF